MSDEREIMSWEQLGTGSRELAEAIYADDWVPDLILGISRGGLLVAGALAYALGVKNTATISVEFYTGIDERLELPMLLPPVPDLVDLSAARVLIADDVADTGATLELVHDFCVGGSRKRASPCCTRSRGRRSSASTSGAEPTTGSSSRGAPCRT